MRLNGSDCALSGSDPELPARPMRALKGLLLGDAQSIVLAAPHDV